MSVHQVLFEEKQRFRQWWLWLLLAVVAGDVLWSVVRGIREAGTGINVYALLLLLPAGLILLFASCTLHTRITEEGIAVRFFPFHREFRYFRWENISRAYVRKYSPLSEYGGWGLRGLGYNRALNISGNQGLQLLMKDGRKLLIGTAKPEIIRQVLQHIPQLQQT